MNTTCIRALWLVASLLPAIHARAGEFKHITIDGSFDDWAGVPPAFEDLSFQDDPLYQEDPGSFANVTDFKTVYVANDEEYLYVRFTLYAPGDPFTSRNNIFLDSDNDFGTGFAALGLVGSEMLIQGGTGYQEKNGGFVDAVDPNSIGNLNWDAAPVGIATNFEFRISRAAIYDSDGLPVFTGDTIAFVLEAENAQYAFKEKAPDDQGLVYTFGPTPANASTDRALVSLTTTPWQVNASGSDLGTGWRELGFDDTQTGWTSGTGLFGFSSNPGVYPAPIQTPLASGHTTYYFRTHFVWTNDPASVVLIASNYLSDGAVVYLNGAEVKRFRLPAGPISATTPASGGPINKGQAELAGIPGAPLVIGDNVIAVEVHQTGGDSADLVFGLSLLAATQFPAMFTDPAQPLDLSVTAGETVTFAADFVGTPPLSFQWLKNSNVLTDATNATLTLASALQADAGSYALRISNQLATNTSRAAVLTVTNSPVLITDAAQPADQTVAEGAPVTFTVVASGSAPISYQWFKNTAAIEGATNAAYTIDNTLASDAGNYHVVVTNPFPSNVTSRTARLTVTTDAIPPTVLNVSGTPNKVFLTFSEPVTAGSANAATNYSLSGGLSIVTAEQDSTDAARVVLTTSAQTLATTYTVTVNNILDRFNNPIAANSHVSFRSTIAIDGSFDDWASVPLALNDPQDSTESIDYKDVYVFNDDQFVYLRVTLYAPGNPADFHNNLFIDADNDLTTGYSVGGVGSEMLIQSGAGYQEKNGTFNEGTIDALDFLIAPEGNGVDFEFRFSRNAKYASDGLPVFTGDTINLVLEAENSGFAIRDLAPDAGGFVYTFSAPSQLGALTIVQASGQVTISWSGPGRLQSTPSLASPSWQDVPNATSPHTVESSNGQAFFRLIQ